MCMKWDKTDEKEQQNEQKEHLKHGRFSLEWWMRSLVILAANWLAGLTFSSQSDKKICVNFMLYGNTEVSLNVRKKLSFLINN